jgi:DNA invertase Pin-like site-specific DNA recombinase
MPQKRQAGPVGAPGAVPALVAYYRVSTASQGAAGLGIEAQRTAVLQHVARLGATLIHEFTEVESGKRTDRPELARALDACRRLGATLIVAKLDRLARNARFLLTIADGCGDGGLLFCDLPALPPGPMGRFFVTLWAGLAELEAGMISQRTKAALGEIRRKLDAGQTHISKKSGRSVVALGNPGLRVPAGAGLARRRAARAHVRRVLPYIDQARRAGCTKLVEIAEALTARGVPTAAGRSVWSAEQVSRVERQRENVQ